MSKTTKEMTKDIVAMFEEYKKQGTAEWDYKIAAFDLSYQVGSLVKRIMQRDGERYDDGLSPDEIKGKIADELADIIAEVLFIGHELDIDIDQAWTDMLQSDEQKISERSKE